MEDRHLLSEWHVVKEEGKCKMHCNDAVETLHRIELGQHEAINKTAVSLSVPSAPVSGTKKMTLGWFRNEQVLACSSCPGVRHGHQVRG